MSPATLAQMRGGKPQYAQLPQPQYGQQKPQEQKQQFKVANQKQQTPAIVVVQPWMGIGQSQKLMYVSRWRNKKYMTLQ
jgi:hypothetical protein